MVLVPSHRASSLLESCACTPAAPATRSTAHPITTAPTTAMRCAWRTTPPSPSLHASPATSASKHATRRTLAHLYGGLFTQVAWKVNSPKSGGPIGPHLIHAPGSLCTTTTCSLHCRGSRSPRRHLRGHMAAFYS